MSIEHNIMQVSQAQLLYSHVLGMSNVGCTVPTQAGQAVGSSLQK